jgi:tRNA pseudouridine55 synthase
MRVLYVVDKPLGWTSHDTVRAVRKALGTRKAGHLGTLDPLATGVLAVAAGPATKLIPFLEGAEKTYLAWIALGAGSATLDAEGPLIDVVERPAPAAGPLISAMARVAARREQVPPAHSAVHVGGRRAYEIARAGEMPVLAPRRVRIHELTLLEVLAAAPAGPVPLSCSGGEWRTGEPEHARAHLPKALAPTPVAVVRARVSAGTYLRAIARDLGAELGMPAHLAGLVRVTSGPFDLRQAVAPAAVGASAGLDPAGVLPWPVRQLSAAELAAVRQGRPIPGTLKGEVVLQDEWGNLAAIALGDGANLKPRRVWTAGEWDIAGHEHGPQEQAGG